MEEIAFSDWPGQPVDLNSGNNPWMPAYGFQTPTALLEKDDFIGNPDAEYFLQGSVGQYMYLETIQEETSDDLRSESDVESRGSPVGWLATDSEAGSVICIETPADEFDCDSDREVACPAKRRRQDVFLTVISDDEGQSLSRSSSLLQFETLEKQCQETCSSSPSVYSQFSFDSLEISRRSQHSPDSLDREDELDFYQCLKVDEVKSKDTSRDSLLYNATRYSGSSDSDETLAAASSFDNLKTWRSFDSLQVAGTAFFSPSKPAREKASVENLSEDSGYSDHLTKCSSASNLPKQTTPKSSLRMGARSQAGFSAYDGDVFNQFQGNFGVSYQDLTISALLEPEVIRSPLIDRFMKGKVSAPVKEMKVTKITHVVESSKEVVVLGLGESKYNCESAPNLVDVVASSDFVYGQQCQSVCVCSVPKDLNLIGGQFDLNCGNSVAVQNFNLADLDFNTINFNSDNGLNLKNHKMAVFKREGSYAEAMGNRVDLSDDEHGLCYKKQLPKTPIIEFDKKVLKAISETSLAASNTTLNQEIPTKKQLLSVETPIISTPRRNVVSTPNLALRQAYLDELDEERRRSIHDIRRKSSLIKSSTSTSGMSDLDEKTLTSLGSSTNSKGVHFSPVVSEVNWRDDTSVSTATPERESSYSLSSSPDREPTPPTPKMPRPKARFNASPRRARSVSQPDLSDTDNGRKKDFIDSLKDLRKGDYSKSQPDVSKFKRRGSQLIKKDKDGCLIKAYVDGDGIQYKHTHLDLDIQTSKSTPTLHAAAAASNPNIHVASSGTSNIESHCQSKRQVKPVNAMEVPDAHQRKDGNKTRAGKLGLGGFFQRLASFRFSAKKGAEEKAKVKKKSQQSNVNNTGAMLPSQRVATKEDYIYIPLKSPSGPVAPSSNHLPPSKPMSSKPPLPKQPPRVVHASVKRDSVATPASTVEGESPRHRHHRRRTIDSGPPMEPMGLIETDLDTEVTVITSGTHANKTRSLLNLGAAEARLTLATPEGEKRHPARPHKSMEFLLDKQNLKVVEPPENELQKGERVMSEHQLRVQRSLQKLTVPDWYKPSQVPREGFLLKKQPGRESRWTGTSSKTTSLSNLTPPSPPTPQSQPFVRWSTSKLNSTASSPCASTRSSFNARQANGSMSPSSARSSFSYRQPYMGWRSQERLSRPRTPAERLACSILQGAPPAPDSREIQTSIKEVTSAIVHYVSGLRPQDNFDSSGGRRSSSASPRGSQKFCWLESSFVGTKPLDSPQTPVTLSQGEAVTAPMNLRLDLQPHNDVTLLTAGGTNAKPSPGSTTLEDVLDSLLGLPSSGRAPSPSLQVMGSANASPSHLVEYEGSEASSSATSSMPNSRRVSLQELRCRYSRCARSATTEPPGNYKKCHNCSYTYCSRACRRAHWEKHRKTCLFSRIGTLCRQVIASAKENKDCLLHLSQMARRGFLSHGLGAVKCFFATPQLAERFLADGLSSLGELTYIVWQHLQPNEMGAPLYAELVKMCKNYNADSKLVLYVSVCVVSETPARGAVKWERQLVSRCAKMRLSSQIEIGKSRDQESPETLILFCPPIGRAQEPVDKVLQLRQMAVANLQKHLIQYGVLLRRQYPAIYRQLGVYCEGSSVTFTPVTVYPKEVATGKSFMCIIMLEAERDCLRQIESDGVKVRTVDVLNYPFSE